MILQLAREQRTESVPKVFLRDLTSTDGGLISASSEHVRWAFYIVKGKLVYASHSVDSFERLERHLKRLSREAGSLDEKVRSQLRLMFEDVDSTAVPAEYLAVSWLVSEQYLSRSLATKLIVRMVQEVTESFLSLSESISQIEHQEMPLRNFYCALEIPKLLDVIDQRLQYWQKLGPQIFSPYQCPYMVSVTLAGKRFPEQTVQRLGRMLRGFNFRQLGALLNRDELMLAKQLHPLICDGAIILRDPIAPYNLLPRSYRIDPYQESENINVLSELFDEDINDSGSITQIMDKQELKTWKIACIDDSQAMLNEIERLLEGDEYSTFLINDSMKALMKMASIRPDLILLDVGMPNVDGYQLCSLIRRSSIFKDIPVVMVTGHKGLLDRARARLAGATDYLTKPFSKPDLLKMVMRHLI
jgi:two-component system, chemotaxis family, response regulator PixG